MKNKTIAALLAFFVGGFGIHKFYLGYNFAGIVYLLLSWTFIPFFLAFMDFLGLVLMSDRAFDSKYNHQLSGSVYGKVDDKYHHHIYDNRAIGFNSSNNNSISENLEIEILRICQERQGATMSECVIATNVKPAEVKKVIKQLCDEGLLVVDNRISDGALVYLPV